MMQMSKNEWIGVGSEGMPELGSVTRQERGEIYTVSMV